VVPQDICLVPEISEAGFFLLGGILCLYCHGDGAAFMRIKENNYIIYIKEFYL
jgi:hypothetical protein